MENLINNISVHAKLIFKVNEQTNKKNARFVQVESFMWFVITFMRVGLG